MDKGIQWNVFLVLDKGPFTYRYVRVYAREIGASINLQMDCIRKKTEKKRKKLLTLSKITDTLLCPYHSSSSSLELSSRACDGPAASE